ncbi:serine/threonine-protein kinase [Chondromyces apiculatus]|uniref:Serine/threonine protein kinase n=1 Tax=Chondromyces apiculatus DSM 436 TaxID=1192034 RepID=A0A017TI18_9BACT|nr:serine/threonine-protein kinase [Chondromyces apiculatus]EYF08923.1 serine/threonine protein kinase [Chondromyces apiculatus DSM 436]
MGGALHLGSGTSLGRYELVLRVASGGMGEVWAARSRKEQSAQQLVAIKVLRPELAEDPALQRMFLDEAEVAARIRHPNVVHGVDRGRYLGTPYLVMEWVAGEPLSAALRGAAGQPAPPLVAARIAYQICAGLASAHELCDDEGRPLGLVHCDVSPENVLITSEGLVRLVDFGVAVYGGPPLSERSGLTSVEGWTAAPPPSSKRGELRGKAPYMAPEHILGAPSDRRADLFAVGILLYEMLAGCHPFLADDDEITMTRIASESPAAPISSRPRPRVRVSELPPPPVTPALERVVSAALAKAPGDRYQDAGALMRALEEAVPGAALPSSDVVVASWLHGVLGDALQVRALRLHEALEQVRRRSERGEGSARHALRRPFEVAVGAALTGEGEGSPSHASGIFPTASGVFPSDGGSVEVEARGEAVREPCPESRRDGALARASAAVVVAAVTCALFGSAATGDSNVPGSGLDPDPPSSRAGRADRAVGRSLHAAARSATRPTAQPSARSASRAEGEARARAEEEGMFRPAVLDVSAPSVELPAGGNAGGEAGGPLGP